MSEPANRWSLARLRRITTSSHHYIAEVDGLRFIAVFSVMLFHVLYAATHVTGASVSGTPFDFLFWPVANGHRGVELFFVISGFILGLPFPAHHLSGSPVVRVGRFYLRRITRLEPPYILALLLFYAAAVVLRTADTQESGFLSGLFLRLGYLHSIVRNERPLLDGVTWTLEIEVQFYLLAPLLAQVFRFDLLPRRLILVAVIGGAPFLASHLPRADLTLPGFIQFFLIGFLTADLHLTGDGGGSPRLYDGVGCAALLATFLLPGWSWFNALFPWLIGLLFLAALRGNRLTTILRNPVIATLGGMCYSLYLLHYPFYSFISSKIVTSGLTLPGACLRVALVALPTAVGAGIVYYILIERPCMNPNWPQILCKRATQLFVASTRALRRAK
jgi:peptidoglycan/LPS O-acetylase OafA/YrhL